mmetsp:Transcript_133654/g.236582  ORF Transcript_133654/g.236582 Transcript_133654/m.236582 type:complete len:248 (-) Transcript_133654:665-1408(-)
MTLAAKSPQKILLSPEVVLTKACKNVGPTSAPNMSSNGTCSVSVSRTSSSKWTMTEIVSASSFSVSTPVQSSCGATSCILACLPPPDSSGLPGSIFANFSSSSACGGFGICISFLQGKAFFRCVLNGDGSLQGVCHLLWRFLMRTKRRVTFQSFSSSFSSNIHQERFTRISSYRSPEIASIFSAFLPCALSDTSTCQQDIFTSKPPCLAKANSSPTRGYRSMILPMDCANSMTSTEPVSGTAAWHRR